MHPIKYLYLYQPLATRKPWEVSHKNLKAIAPRLTTLWTKFVPIYASAATFGIEGREGPVYGMCKRWEQLLSELVSMYSTGRATGRWVEDTCLVVVEMTFELQLKGLVLRRLSYLHISGPRTAYERYEHRDDIARPT
jgi:hypothetical protein